jgi:VanZ family protein
MAYPLDQQKRSTNSALSSAKTGLADLPTWFYWLALLIWMSLIFWFSHQPPVPGLPDALFDLLFKKLAHATAYGILMGLWWAALKGMPLSGGSRLIVAFLLTLLYAVSDEWHQTFVSNRHGQLTDVLIDSIGILITTLIIRLRRQR